MFGSMRYCGVRSHVLCIHMGIHMGFTIVEFLGSHSVGLFLRAYDTYYITSKTLEPPRNNNKVLPLQRVFGSRPPLKPRGGRLLSHECRTQRQDCRGQQCGACGVAKEHSSQYETYTQRDYIGTPPEESRVAWCRQKQCVIRFTPCMSKSITSQHPSEFIEYSIDFLQQFERVETFQKDKSRDRVHVLCGQHHLQ